MRRLNGKTQWNRAFDDFDAKTSHLKLSDGTGHYFSLRAIAISQFQRTRHLQQKHSFQNQCKKTFNNGKVINQRFAGQKRKT